jgi:hypothetical protein
MKNSSYPLQDHWYEGTTSHYFWQAKVYPAPSQFGIVYDGSPGRVSKLTICRVPYWDNGDNVCFNYDRGLDFNSCPRRVLNAIVRHLEGLPR